MTNGEKIKEIFPNTKIITQYDNPFGDRFMVFTLNNEDMQVNINWWNAEYKKASPIRPKRHWIDVMDGNALRVECSECHKLQCNKSNFCPNCGADMREVEE